MHTATSFPPLIDLHQGSAATAAAEERLAALPAGQRDRLAASAQANASARGLRFVRQEGPRDIPLLLSPVGLPADQHDALGAAARRVVTALLKAAHEVLAKEPARAALLFSHLSPLELQALATRAREADELLLARVDWFVDRDRRLRALEVNATIPAMPVYSDAAARGWLATLAPALEDALFAANGSNASWLVSAILSAARQAGRGGESNFPRDLEVQLLHRPGDPQISELRSLVELLEARGARARTCTPDDVVLDGDPRRMIYRHLFARYVEPASALGAALLDPARHGIWNRVDGWLEVKGLFAELSLYAEERPQLFDEDELQVLHACVPWTRLLDDVTDAELIPRAPRLVLKKSNDYGGKSVVVGNEVGAESFRTALAGARRDPPASWVVQELVDSPSVERWLCHDGGAKQVSMHMDISTYASLIPGVPHGGSVCRASPKSVVNIVGGGGVAPLFREDVLARALGGHALVPLP